MSRKDIAAANPTPSMTDHERAAQKRRAAVTAPNPEAAVQAYIDALLVERRGFVQRGEDTVQIDAEIVRCGGNPSGDTRR